MRVGIYKNCHVAEAPRPFWNKEVVICPFVDVGDRLLMQESDE